MFSRTTIFGFGLALASCMNHEGLFAQPREKVVEPAAIATPSVGESPAKELAPARAEEAVVVAEPPVPTRVRTIGRCNDEELTSPIARFSIVHMNDLQARYSDRIHGKSRYAYVAGAIAEARRRNPNTLVLDAGDDYEKGSLADLRSMGEATRQMIAALGIDVRTIGNHDFSYGESAVLRDVTRSPHPVLSANIRKRNGESPFLPYVEVDVGCVKVGIVGLTTQNYGADDQPTREPYCGVWQQDPHYTEILSREVRAHRHEVDVMIALTHLGLFEDAALAQNVPGVDFVIGAHTEDLVREPRPVLRSDGSVGLVMQAGHYGETLGMADIVVTRSVTPEGGNKRERSVGLEHYRIVDVNADVPPDDAVAELADRLERKYTPGLHSTLATNVTEVKVGKEMADLLWDAVQHEWGADALLVGKDAFWTGLPPGPVTLSRLYDSVLVQREPTGTSGFTSLQIVSITGRELLALRGAYTYGPLYELYIAGEIQPSRRYRFVVDKRAHTFPGLLFRDSLALPKARFGGEIIDVLESYARSRSRRGLPLR